MTKVRTPPFGASATLGILPAVYLVLVVLSVIVAAVVGATTGTDLDLGFLTWLVPWIFPIASLLVLADVIRGVATHQQVTQKLPILALIAALLTAGAAFALSSHHGFGAVPVVVSGCVLAMLVLGSLRLIGRRG